MKKIVAVLVIFCVLLIFGTVCYANESGKTQINDNSVFIDEQPIFTYLYGGINYVSVTSLEKYGFDVIEEINTLTMKRNQDKAIELAPKSLINRKKGDALFSKIYPVSEGKQTVLLEGKQIASVIIEGQECIDIASLSNYATIAWDEETKVLKLDYKKKEFEIKQSKIASKTIDYPDAESAGRSGYVHEFILGRYTGEVSGRKRNGYGIFEFEYIDGGHLSDVTETTVGYWKNDLPNGLQIYEYQSYSDTLYGEPRRPNKVLERYILRQRYYKDEEGLYGTFLNVNIWCDILNKDRSDRTEGVYYGDGYDGIYRVSKIDESYKYGYYVVSETVWDKGEIALSREEILTKFDEIYPPLGKKEISEIDANIEDDLPATLEECYIEIEKMLEPKDIQKIKSGTKDDLVELHFGLGMAIRNSWLWGGQSGVYKYFVLNGITHPDNMSGIIIEGFYHYLNGRELDIEEIFYQHKKEVVIANMTQVGDDSVLIAEIDGANITRSGDNYVVITE